MRILILFIAFFLNVAYATAQQSIKEVLGSMPEEVMPYMNSDQKAELSRFADAEDSVKVKNMFNSTVSLDAINDSYAKLRLNDAACIQIKLLPLSDTTKIICLVKTIEKPVPESTIQFYTSTWEPIKSSLGLPGTENTDSLVAMFTQRADSVSVEKYADLCRRIEPVIIHAEISEKENIITLGLSLLPIKEEESDNVKSILKQISFKWEYNTFKKC